MLACQEAHSASRSCHRGHQPPSVDSAHGGQEASRPCRYLFLLKGSCSGLLGDTACSNHYDGGNANFPLPSSFLHRLTGISVRKICFFSSTDSVISIRRDSRDIYSILSLIRQSYYSLLSYSNFQLWPLEAFFGVASGSFYRTCQFAFQVPPNVLGPRDAPGSFCIFPPSLGSTILQGAQIPLLENGVERPECGHGLCLLWLSVAALALWAAGARRGEEARDSCVHASAGLLISVTMWLYLFKDTWVHPEAPGPAHPVPQNSFSPVPFLTHNFCLPQGGPVNHHYLQNIHTFVPHWQTHSLLIHTPVGNKFTN